MLANFKNKWKGGPPTDELQSPAMSTNTKKNTPTPNLKKKYNQSDIPAFPTIVESPLKGNDGATESPEETSYGASRRMSEGDDENDDDDDDAMRISRRSSNESRLSEGSNTDSEVDRRISGSSEEYSLQRRPSTDYESGTEDEGKVGYVPPAGFGCQFCFKLFRKRSLLIAHERIHQNLRPFKCDQCPKDFRDFGALGSHKIRLHSREFLKFNCGICSKRFRYERELDIHRRMHSGSKPYHCGFCEKRFTQLGNQRSHVRRHFVRHGFVKSSSEGNSFAARCLLCFATFSDGIAMEAHTKQHISDDDVKLLKTKTNNVVWQSDDVSSKKRKSESVMASALKENTDQAQMQPPKMDLQAAMALTELVSQEHSYQPPLQQHQQQHQQQQIPKQYTQVSLHQNQNQTHPLHDRMNGQHNNMMMNSNMNHGHGKMDSMGNGMGNQPMMFPVAPQGQVGGGYYVYVPSMARVPGAVPVSEMSQHMLPAQHNNLDA